MRRSCERVVSPILPARHKPRARSVDPDQPFTRPSNSSKRSLPCRDSSSGSFSIQRTSAMPLSIEFSRASIASSNSPIERVGAGGVVPDRRVVRLDGGGLAGPGARLLRVAQRACRTHPTRALAWSSGCIPGAARSSRVASPALLEVLLRPRPARPGPSGCVPGSPRVDLRGLGEDVAASRACPGQTGSGRRSSALEELRDRARWPARTRAPTRRSVSTATAPGPSRRGRGATRDRSRLRVRLAASASRKILLASTRSTCRASNSSRRTGVGAGVVRDRSAERGRTSCAPSRSSPCCLPERLAAAQVVVVGLRVGFGLLLLEVGLGLRESSILSASTIASAISS